MKSKFLILFTLIFISSKLLSQAGPCKEVIGYYPSWQWYDRSNLVKPSTIDYSKYSIINYAFLKPLPDGSLTITDAWADKNLLLGTINWSTAPTGYDSQVDLGNPAYHNPNTSLIHYAHTNNVEVMVSVGGWTLSNDFPAIAASPTKRTNFAHYCNKVIRLYDLDGIDIDWEYPGYTPHGGTTNDKTNYTLLMKELRDSLDALEIELTTNLKLTAAFGAAPARMADVEWDSIVPLMDYINLMSYDFFGSFSPKTNHNSPLYAPLQGDSTFNLHSAVHRLINTYNVPSNKITLGVAFYGRSAKTSSTPGIHVNTTGSADAVTFSMDGGTPQYYNILKKKNLFNDNWDNTAAVPYLTGKGALNTFVSYDNEKSIGLKAKYVIDNNLAGVIIWEITGDYIESSSTPGVILDTPLADTLNSSLCLGISTTSISDINMALPKLKLYPNPVSNNLIIEFDNSLTWSNLIISNTIGKIVYESNKSTKKIDVSNFLHGLYIVNIKTKEGDFFQKFIKE
jgi:chitinase